MYKRVLTVAVMFLVSVVLTGYGGLNECFAAQAKKAARKKLPDALFQEVVDAGSRKTFFVNCGIIDLK